jgi:hypothetical protein
MERFVEVQGVRVPRFIYGTAWKEHRTEGLTRLALEVGFRGIDTANQRKHYFEAGVGAAIAAARIARDELFLQTKFTPAPRAWGRHAFRRPRSGPRVGPRANARPMARPAPSGVRGPERRGWLDGSKRVAQGRRPLSRRGGAIMHREEQGMSYLAETDPDTRLRPLGAAACALGPRAGQKVLSLQTVPTRAVTDPRSWTDGLRT